jgi:hypothetical protein
MKWPIIIIELLPIALLFAPFEAWILPVLQWFGG